MGATPTYVGAIATLAEDPGSPQTVLGESVVRTRTYRGTYALCAASALPRGTLGTGDETGFSVRQCTYAREKGDRGILVIEWEATAGSALPAPPDEFSLEPFDINPRVERHPNFSSVTAQELAQIWQARNGSTADERDEALQWVYANGSDQAVVLVDLFVKGVENYYLSGLKFSQLIHSYSAPSCTLGGFIQVPFGAGSGLIPSGASWLRKADGLTWSGGVYKLTRTWVGAPLGHWDPVIYPVV